MRPNAPLEDEEQLNRELDRLFAAYYEACPAPDAGPDFMPRLWRKIDARRSATYTFGRWTKAFVTAAAALCVLLGLLQTYLQSQPTFYTQTYIEALQQETAAEGATYFEALWTEDGGSSLQ